MRNLLNKAIAVIVVTIMTMINFLPATVYATEEIQNASTSEANVEFDAKINDSYDVRADIDSELDLNISLKVSNTGYVKDAKVVIENNNYEVIEDSVVNMNKTEDGYSLNNVNSDEELKASAKIKFNKDGDQVNVNDVKKTSTVTLNAVYVDKNREKKISKKLSETIEWTAYDAEIEANQEIVRYIKNNGNTIISYRISDKVKDNKMPYSEKTITTKVPKLNGVDAKSVNVVGKDISFENKDNAITINKINNKTEEGFVNTDTSSDYVVTAIYETQVETAEIEIESEIKTKLINTTTELTDTKKNSFVLSEEVGSIVELSYEGTPELNKGYMYTNILRDNKLDTTFNTAYKINIGAKDLTNKIVLNENAYKFDDTQIGLVNTKINTVKEELVKVLGEDGTITVQDETGNNVAVLNKDITEVSIQNGKLKFITSNPVEEGIVTINVDRKIDNNNSLTREQIKAFEKLNIEATVEGYSDDTLVSTKNTAFEIRLVEPTSKANVNIEPDSFSTIVENEDIEFDITLDKKDISDALYSNPSIRIELPKQVSSINYKNGSIAFDDELQAKNIQINGRTIEATIEGTQTKYSEDEFIKGTEIKIVADVILNNLETSADENVIVTITNNATGEVINKEVPVKIIAPSQFITTHTIEVDNKRAVAIGSAKQVELEKGSSSKVARISGKIINNLNETAKELTVVGRIPVQGNKSLAGQDLGTTVTTTLNGEVKVDNANTKILYSNDVNEDINGTWSEVLTSESKSFKIVVNEDVEHAKELNFNYEVTIPANLVSGSELIATYGVYYSNNAAQGIKYNSIFAANVGAYTEKDDTLTIDVKAYDTNTGKQITSETYAGEYITYIVTVKNIAKSRLTNVNLDAVMEGYEIVNSNDNRTEYNLLKANSINNKYYPARFIKYNEYDEAKVHSDSFLNEYDYNENVNAVANINTIKELVNGKYQDVTSQRYSIGDLNAEESKDIKILVRADGYSKNFDVNDIKMNFTATSNQKKSTSTVTLKNTDNDVYVDLYSQSNGILKIGETGIFEVFVENLSYEDSGNIDITVDVPKGLEVVKLEGYRLGRETDSNGYYGDVDLSKFYNKSTGKIKVNSRDLNNIITGKSFENIPARAYTYFYFTVKAVSETNTSGMKVTAKSSKYNRDIQSQVINPITEDIKKVLTVKYDGPDTALDTDRIKYTITIKSTSKATNTYVLKDIIPEDIEIDSISKTIVGGNTVELGKTNSFNTRDSIESNQTIIYTLSGYVDRMYEGTTKTVTTTPSFVANGNTIYEVNSITTQIKGTKPIVKPDEDGKINDDVEDPSKTYKVSGVVWFDTNNNGIRENGESRSKGNRVRLYDGKNVIAETTVGEDGTYEFSDIKVGKYYVIISYDNKEYMVSKLRVTDATESTNNDFTAETYYGENVAATAVVLKNANINNIDLGLSTRKTFDFALDKTVSSISIRNTAYNARDYSYVGAKKTKVELPAKNIENTTVIVEYKIKVTNEGRVPGWVKSIVDYKPKGMKFDGSMNLGWYETQDGELICNLLENKELKSGETEEVSLYLTRAINGENLGTINNTAEIGKLYNIYGYEDADSKEYNKSNDEDDISSADVTILMATGKEKASIIGITLGIISLIGVAIYYIKKKVINKMYRDII